MKNTHDTTLSANKKKLNREIIGIGLVTGLATLLLFAWMARGGGRTQAAGLGDSIRSSLTGSANYVAGKLGWATSAAAVAGNVTGTVFQDYNGNGTLNTTATLTNDGNASTTPLAVDRGISGVTVNVYNDANTVIATTTTCGTAVAGVCTGNNPGFYQLTVPVGTNLVRVEFVNLPAGYESSAQGADSQSNVRFVDTTAGNVANMNFAINVPRAYSPNNPTLATTCFVVGAQNSAANTNQVVVLSFPYSSGANSTVSAEYGVPTTHSLTTNAPAVGTTWGVAYARKARRLYAASYFKKYAGFGPGADGVFNSTVNGAGVYQAANSSDDAGAIYVINRDTNALASTFTLPGATTNPHKTDAYDRDNGNTGWDATGKFSLGGVDLSDDEARLYVMNLQNRTLYALNRATGAVLASQAVPTATVPLPTGNCAAGDVRPFAVKFHQGQLYVGMVCSAESTATVDSGWTDTNGNGRYNAGEPFTDGDGNGIYNLKDARSLRVYVYTVNPTTLVFGATPVFQAALNYPRGIPEPSNGGYRSHWLPWTNAFPTNMAGVWANPQPLLTDLEFDDAGNLMLALRDRAGDQGGEAALDNPANNTTYAVRPSGDLLKACGSLGSWTLESNGRCGGVGAAPQGTGQGPGNGEFFHNDDYSTNPNAGQFHDEVMLGSLTQLLGYPNVVASAFDPIPRPLVEEAFTGGFRWLGLTTGTFNKAYRVYLNTAENFGKASGLGDVEPLSDLPPVEIGNRVWMDADNDGLQDPSEMALAGVTVRLYNNSNTLVATAVTDANGAFAFSNDPRGYPAAGNNAPNNTASNGGFVENNQGGRTSTASRRYGIAGLTLGGSYQLRFDNATNYTTGNPLFGKLLTVRDVGTNSQDTRDSDAQTPVAGPIGAGNYPFIAVDLTAVTEGQNQHNFDAGFRVCHTITISPATLPPATVGVAYSQTLTASGDTAPYTFAVTTGTLPTGFTLTSAGVLSGTATAAGANTFTVTATDVNGCTGSLSLTLTRVCPTVTVSPASPTPGLPAMTVGTAYSQTITATGGTGHTFAVTAGMLPTGLTLTSAGVLSGTPSSSTAASFTITATNSNGCTGAVAYNITPTCPTITVGVTPTTLPSGTVGTAYPGATFSASGGTAPYTFAVVTAGTLPAGLTLTNSRGAGVLSGTPTSSATANFTIRATDNFGCTGTQAYSITPACPTITVNPATLPALNAGASFSQVFTATNTTGALTWSVTGTLPAGLTFNAATATLSGTVSSAAAFDFTVQVTDANNCSGSRNYPGSPACATITLSPASPVPGLPNATVNTTYNATVSASGGATPYTYSVTTGQLPAGLSLTTSGVNAGQITGTPTSTTSRTFTITATDANNCTGSLSFTLQPACNTLSVTPNTLPTGTVGVLYPNQTLSVSGNNGAVTWNAPSNLPAGLTFANGVIGGTPTVPTTGTSVTFTATDANGCQGSVTISIRVNCAAITVNPATLGALTVGTAFSQTFTATNTTGTLTWSATGTLPAGLTFTNGVLSGTPTSSAPFNFTVSVTDANGCQGSRNYSGTPGCTTITVGPATLPNATVGTAYSAAMTATGGSTPYTFAVTNGSLPAGLSLSTSGAITGTPTTAGAFTFTITATDAAGCTGERTFTVRTCDVITVTPASLPNATINQAYSQTLGATGGTGPYTFTLTGSLPAGLNLLNGVISGVPTATGSSTFTINVNDSTSCPGSRQLSITVVCATIAISPSSLPSGTVGTAYSQQLSATGVNGTLTWTLVSGSNLPTGLNLSSSGLISGTPTANGNTTFTVRVTDANGCTNTAQLSISIGCPTITVNPATLPAATVGAAYSQQLTATGGGASYTFAVASGSTLPAGLTLTSAGLLSGTPTSSASVTFTITATDGSNCPGSRSFTLTPTCPTITVSPATLPNGTMGAAYSQTLNATGGTAPYTFAITSGTLPAGLSLTGATIGGMPAAAGSAMITVRATDANGCFATRDLTITINCPTITVTPASLPNGQVGAAYSASLGATGGTGPYTFGILSGSLPAGLTLSSNTGVYTIGGTPTSTVAATFVIQATDARGCTGSLSFTITPICNTFTVNPASLPAITRGVPYSATLSTTGATGAVTYAVTVGALPTGLTLSGATISGTTNVSTATTFTITATDSNGCQAAREYTLTPNCPAITVNPASLANGQVGAAYSQTLSATGGATPYTFSVTAGQLPAGLTLTGATIAGTPTSTVSRTFTITATDANGCTGTREFTVTPICNTNLAIAPASLPNGQVGAVYSQALSVTNGLAPVMYAITAGSLPNGLTLSGATIGGTPTSTMARTFTITATDANGCTAAREFTVTPICNTNIVLNPATLPNPVRGVAYSQTLSVTNATGAVTYALTGSLPTGLTLSGNTISGTTNSATAATFTITATDANGCTASRQYTLTPGCATITVASTTLPNGQVGVLYNATITATGGAAPYGFNVSVGQLPAGLTLNPTTGVISGTPTSTTSRTFTISVTDANNCPGSQSFTIAPACNTLTINQASLPNGTVGAAYNQTLTVTGATGAVTWTMTGTLPNGLTFANGVMSGTPTAPTAAPASLSLRATDANGCFATATLTITVGCNTLNITTASLPNPVAGVGYDQTLAAMGGTAPLTWTLSSGTLPTGLTLSAAGVISGTTNDTTAHTFTVRVTDANGCFGSRSFTLTAGCSTITFATPTSLPQGTVGAVYPSTTFTVTGGATPYTFSIANGTLPTGMTFTTGGVLSGTPTVPASGTLTFRLTDNGGCTATIDLALVINCQTITIDQTAVGPFVVGTPYSQQLTATGGRGALTWSLVTPGTIPAGLTLSSTGLLSGTPTSSAGATFTIRVTDVNGCRGERTYTVSPNCPTITVSATLPNGTVGAMYSQTVSASGGATPYAFSVIGTLPAGLSLVGNTISGTPASTTATTFTIRTTDANGCFGSTQFTITPVCNTLTINQTSLSAGTMGASYAQQLTATGSSGALTWTVSAGALPGGLTLSNGGLLSGTPMANGNFNFTIKVTDGNGCMGTIALSISVGCPTVTVNPATLSAAIVGTAYNQTISATGGTAPYTFAVTVGTLPTGLTMSSAGAISGTPAAVGTFNFTIEATDANGCKGTRSFTVVATCAAITVTPASLPPATVGSAYSQQLSASGANGTLTWALTSGTLPNGMTFVASGPNAGLLSGTPTAPGSPALTFRVTDTNGCQGTATLTLNIVCNTVTVNPATLPNGFVGVAYNQTLTVAGATGATTWNVSSSNGGGTLPNGLTLSSAGVLSGTPTAAASSTFTVRVVDANNCPATREFTIAIAQVFSIGNRVFKDLNDDGLLNNGDTGINGVVVRLATSAGAIAKTAAGVDVAPITTASGGYYRFDGLAAGDYIVEVAASNFTGTGMLVGCTSSTRDAGDPDSDVDDNDDNGLGTTASAGNGIRSAVLTLGPNAGSEPSNETDRSPTDPAEPNNNTNLTVDFGFTTTMSLGNLVWKDLNNNGRFDTGEPGVDGVKLDLYLDRDNSGGFSSADSPAVANTTTANGGFYSFTGLTPGKYVVNVINLNFRTGGALLGCFSSTVTASNPDNDVDNDDNGADDNDPANNGSASRVITLVGFGEPTTDGDGNNGNATVDFGFYAPVNLGNAVWKDANNNGRKDSGEPGIDGGIVELLKDADNSGALNGSELTTVIQTRGTLNGGTYQFTNLPPGNYVVRLAASNFVGAGALVGCTSSSTTNANPNDNTDNDDNGIDNNAPATNGILSGVTTLTSFGEPPVAVDGDDTNSNGTVDFGFYTPVNLGNLIYKDLNNNGFREGGEPGINGVRVELFRDANGNNQLDANDGGAIANSTTINGGVYSFPNLAPGSYFVRIAASNFASGGSLFECVSSTVTNANANSNTDNDDNGIDVIEPAASGITSGVITLQGGTEPPANVDGDDTNGNQTVDFGFVSANQSIGNAVWKDANRNGRRDNGETGVGGVKLNLYRDNGDGSFNASNDVLIKMTTSGAAGNYQFTGLITATYFVQIDASNFGNDGATAGALNGCISTNGTNNPNTDVDDDDNGSDSYNPATQPPTSGPIVLTTNGEPPATVDGDGANGNNTIDFGFINFLNITIEDPATCVGPGVVLQLTARLTNPSNVTQRDNAGNEFEAQLPAEVVLVPNSCVASSGACSFDGNRRVVWNGSLAPNSTLTLSYKIQLANNVQAGVPYCITSLANFDADNNGSNETSASVTVCDVATCPQVGPGTPNEGCSVLIFPVYTSNASNPARGNTRISITNTSVNQPATMHLFFVDGESCSIADSYLCLTPNQTTSFTMADLDPGTTGYMIAVAVDAATGCPTYFNHLIGDSYVKFDSGHSASLKAQCAKALPGGDFSCNPNEQMATLNFDDVQYSRLPQVLSVDSIPSPADGNDTRLYLTRIGGDMAVGADSLGALFGLVFDDAEKSYSFGATVPTCQLRTPLNGTYPRTTPRIDSIIPAGRSGWMKVWTQGGGAMVGAAITRNANAISQPGAFNGGHDLHVLRYAESASISIPIFPGHCQ